MHDLKEIRQDPERFRRGVEKKGGDSGEIDRLVDLDARRRGALARVEALRAQRNRASEAIAASRRSGQPVSEMAQTEARGLGEQIGQVEAELAKVEPEIQQILSVLPNIPNDDVPEGDESHNREVRRWGDLPAFSGPAKAHWEIGVDLGIVDFERAGKVSGPRFAFLKGDGARLERALIDFMLDLHTRQHGYTEIWPPLLVNAASAFGTGQLPKFGQDMFQTTDGYYLIPTAEVPVTNLHSGEILAGSDLPIRYCAYTPCFRSEAGAAGRDTRGLIRNHQFNKVELVKFTAEESSYQELETLRQDAESVLEALALPYRTVVVATREMTFANTRQYDLEVWFPAQNTYREISSCSNFEAFQARRANIRYRSTAGDVRHVHTLNGSALAVGRTFSAILENYQQPDGTVIVPEVLRSYLGGQDRLGKG